MNKINRNFFLLNPKIKSLPIRPQFPVSENPYMGDLKRLMMNGKEGS